jgi:hypothetical protein
MTGLLSGGHGVRQSDMETERGRLPLKHCGALQLTEDSVLRSFDIICGALGAEWFAEQEAKEQRLTGYHGRHPLYRELTAHTKQCLALMVEIATYLEDFSNDPELPKAIQGLRTDAYESTLLELAMAYRWKQVAQGVRLFPRTPNGIGDFSVTMPDRKLLVEASTVPADLLTSSKARLMTVAELALRTQLVGCPLTSLKVVFHRMPEGNIDERLTRTVRELCRKYKAEGYLPQVYECQESQISIEATGNEPNPLAQPIRDIDRYGHENDWSGIASIGVFPKLEGQFPEQSGPEAGSELARIFMRLPLLPGTPVDRVVRKYKRESRQLRGVSDSRAVILDLSGIEEISFELVFPEIQGALVREMSTSPETVGVWLLRRGWTARNRYGYGGRYLSNPGSRVALPAPLLQSLMMVERRLAFK